MPKVKAGETRDAFVKRCVPVVIHDGTAKDGAAAVAVCNSLWDQHEKAALSVNTAKVNCTYLDAEVRRKGQYRKDVIKVGEFVHPNTGQAVTVTRDRLEHWHKSFHEMQAAGINIPIRDGHSGPALGHIAGSSVADDKLNMLHDFPDDDAVVTAKRNRYVSVGVVPTYTDCHGHTWNDVIDHVALTPTPVITGQSEFVALSREPTADPGRGPASTKEESMEWLNSELGLATDATEDDAKAKIAELKARPEKVAAQEPDQPGSADPEVLSIMRDAVSERLDMAIKDGIITPAKRTMFEQVFLGTKEAPNGFCLDRRASKTDRALASLALEILTLKDDPVADGTKTSGQIPPGSTTLARKEETDAAEKATAEKAEADKLLYHRRKDLLARGTTLTDEATSWMSRYENANEL